MCVYEGGDNGEWEYVCVLGVSECGCGYTHGCVCMHVCTDACVHACKCACVYV